MSPLLTLVLALTSGANAAEFADGGGSIYLAAAIVTAILALTPRRP